MGLNSPGNKDRRHVCVRGVTFRPSSIQIVRRHQELQTQLARDIHVLHARAVTVLLVVVEVLDHLLQDHAADVLQVAGSG